jgi:hypothetical protein
MRVPRNYAGDGGLERRTAFRYRAPAVGLCPLLAAGELSADPLLPNDRMLTWTF